jgi:hypothetical protein
MANTPLLTEKKTGGFNHLCKRYTRDGKKSFKKTQVNVKNIRQPIASSSGSPR